MLGPKKIMPKLRLRVILHSAPFNRQPDDVFLRYSLVSKSCWGSKIFNNFFRYS